MSKKDAFFKFRDDQKSESASEAEEEPQEQAKQDENNNETVVQVKKDVNVKGAIPDEENPEGHQEHDKEVQVEEVKKPKKKKKVVQSGVKVFFIIFLGLIVNILFTYPITGLLGLVAIFVAIFDFKSERYFKSIANAICLFTISFSILAVVFEAIKSFRSEDVIGLWFLDAFLLFITHIMIFTIIKMTKQSNFDFSFKNVCSCGGDTLGVLVFSFNNHPEELTEIEWVVDVPLSESEWKDEYIRIMEISLEADILNQRFNTFLNKLKHPNIKQYIGYQFIKGQNGPMRPQFAQFITLLGIALLKVMCSLLYFYLQKHIGFKEIIFVVILTIFNFNETYCLNIMLSNYDLRRKTIMITHLNKALKITGTATDYQSNLDVTCTDSIETWDNSRRAILEMFEGIQSSLEKCYIYLFLYYLFILNICLAAYGDINLIIEKDSIFLQPLMIITATINFIFINSFIFFRIYFGQKFNDTFEESQENIENLIGIYQDLSQMFDAYFTHSTADKEFYIEYQKEVFENAAPVEDAEENQDEELSNQNKESQNKQKEIDSKKAEENECASDFSNYSREYATVYEVIVSKIKYMSNFYIEKKEEFIGKVYDSSNEKQLQLKMVENTLKSLKRIKQQIEIDSKSKGYKLLGLVQLGFQDALVFVVFGLSTLLPQIISTFLEQFKNPASAKF